VGGANPLSLVGRGSKLLGGPFLTGCCRGGTALLREFWVGLPGEGGRPECMVHRAVRRIAVAFVPRGRCRCGVMGDQVGAVGGAWSWVVRGVEGRYWLAGGIISGRGGRAESFS